MEWKSSLDIHPFNLQRIEDIYGQKSSSLRVF